MARFAVRRLLYAAVVLWLVSTLVFVFLHVSPVPVERVIGGPRATADTLRQIRANLGLDRPVLVQYWRFTGRLLSGDLGDSYVNGTPVTALIGARLPTTLLLVAAPGSCGSPAASRSGCSAPPGRGACGTAPRPWSR